MAANNEPQPSTSSGVSQQNGQAELPRTETATSSPLTEEEYAQVQKELGAGFTLTAMGNVPDRQNSLTSQTSSETPTPQLVRATPLYSALSPTLLTMVVAREDLFIARGQSEMEVCLETSTPNSLLHNQQSHEMAWGDLRDPLDRTDTLDRNPHCVDPNLVTPKLEHHQHQQHQQMVASEHAPIEGQQQFTNIMTTVNIPNNDQNIWTGEHPVASIVFGPEDLQLLNANQGQGHYQGPTSANPCTDDYPGEYQFRVSFVTMSATNKNKYWDYSSMLNKLYIDMNKFVNASFSVGPSPPDGLLIRALPIYAQAGFFTSPVKRCPNHAAPDDHTNKDLMWSDKRDHLIRVDNDFATYEEDLESKRLSVIIPVQRPQAGSLSVAVPIKFMCLGSDVGGINRKPLKVIFTLEHGVGNVVARHAVDIRICSCPKRDKIQDEKKRSEDLKKANKLAGNLSRANSSLMYVPLEKKRKLETVEEMIMVPVAKRDFEKVNEIAENYMIVRHGDKIDEIKAQRKKLLRTHNPNTFTAPQKPPKDAPKQ